MINQFIQQEKSRIDLLQSNINEQEYLIDSIKQTSNKNVRSELQEQLNIIKAQYRLILKSFKYAE